jgi:hypothetical protein
MIPEKRTLARSVMKIVSGVGAPNRGVGKIVAARALGFNRIH